MNDLQRIFYELDILSEYSLYGENIKYDNDEEDVSIIHMNLNGVHVMKMLYRHET